MLQWLRKVRVTFSGSGGSYIINPGDTVAEHELVVAFSVRRSISSQPNTASLTLQNLSEDHRNSLGRELDTVQIEAGYEGAIGIIFHGQIRDIEHKASESSKRKRKTASPKTIAQLVQSQRSGTEIETTIDLGDGDAALRSAVISKTFPAGTPVKDVIEGVYEELEAQGLSRGEWALPEDILEEYKRPYTTYGTANKEMNLLSRSHKFYWSIQNGVVEIIPHNGALPGTIYVSSATGLLEVPTRTDNGIKVRAMLNPQASPNRSMTVQSEIITLGENSMYRISEAEFYGDNYKGAFEMRLTGETLTSGKVDEGVGVEDLIAAAKKAIPV